MFPLKPAVDEACESTPSIEHVVVVKRGGNDVTMVDGRDHWYHDLMDGASADCPAEPMDAEHLLFLLYTSGTTGKPKGIVHTTGGYLTRTYAHPQVRLRPASDDDVYWCTADVGWITGHSYIVYGPLANGALSVMYEGAPNHPATDRFWEIVEKYGVTIFYTAPTAIRTFMKWGDEHPAKHDLSSLRLLGTVGEPINPEAWMWYHEQIGGERCPIVDTWWQTETGGIMITPLPGATTTKPGSATLPLPGVSAELVDDEANTVPVGGGYLALDPAVAGDAARDLGRPGALPGDVLVAVPRPLLRGRRRQARRRRLLLDPRSRRRRDERVGAPHLDHGGRISARLAPVGRRGGGRRRQTTRPAARPCSPS